MNALLIDGISQRNIFTVTDLLSVMSTQEDIELPRVGELSRKTKGSIVRFSHNLIPICIIVAQLLYYCKYALCCDFLFYSRKRKIVSSLYLLGGSFIIFMFILLGLIKLRYAQRRQALRQLVQRHQQSRQALVRYVMLNRQCSEKTAYQRIATFVKTHFPSEDQGMFDRPSLLDKAGSILILHPDEIDKI